MKNPYWFLLAALMLTFDAAATYSAEHSFVGARAYATGAIMTWCTFFAHVDQRSDNEKQS